jgi:hypothetical protein
MALPKPRDKFWVVDPPAVFDDTEDNPDGVILICVFSTKKLLRDFHSAQTGEVVRKDIFSRRYSRLQKDCTMLQWNGIVIDADPETGKGRIIRFDGQADLEAFRGPEAEDAIKGVDGESAVEHDSPAPAEWPTILTGLALQD